MKYVYELTVYVDGTLQDKGNVMDILEHYSINDVIFVVNKIECVLNALDVSSDEEEEEEEEADDDNDDDDEEKRGDATTTYFVDKKEVAKNTPDDLIEKCRQELLKWDEMGHDVRHKIFGISTRSTTKNLAGQSYTPDDDKLAANFYELERQLATHIQQQSDALIDRVARRWSVAHACSAKMATQLIDSQVRDDAREAEQMVHTQQIVMDELYDALIKLVDDFPVVSLLQLYLHEHIAASLDASEYIETFSIGSTHEEYIPENLIRGIIWQAQRKLNNRRILPFVSGVIKWFVSQFFIKYYDQYLGFCKQHMQRIWEEYCQTDQLLIPCNVDVAPIMEAYLSPSLYIPPEDKIVEITVFLLTNFILNRRHVLIEWCDNNDEFMEQNKQKSIAMNIIGDVDVGELSSFVTERIKEDILLLHVVNRVPNLNESKDTDNDSQLKNFDDVATSFMSLFLETQSIVFEHVHSHNFNSALQTMSLLGRGREAAVYKTTVENADGRTEHVAVRVLEWDKLSETRRHVICRDLFHSL